MVAEELRTKYTLHARALFFNTTAERAAVVRVVEILKMDCFVASPAASSVRVPVKVTAMVGKVHMPESKVIPPRSDDGRASVLAIERALSLNR